LVSNLNSVAIIIDLPIVTTPKGYIDIQLFNGSLHL